MVCRLRAPRRSKLLINSLKINSGLIEDEDEVLNLLPEKEPRFGSFAQEREQRFWVLTFPSMLTRLMNCIVSLKTTRFCWRDYRDEGLMSSRKYPGREAAKLDL